MYSTVTVLYLLMNLREGEREMLRRSGQEPSNPMNSDNFGFTFGGASPRLLADYTEFGHPTLQIVMFFFLLASVLRSLAHGY